MLLECRNCGAPLDVSGTARKARCNYCGQATEVRSARTVAQETPPDWKPPPSWRPPADRQLPDISLPYRAAGRAIVKLVSMIGTLILISGGVGVWWFVESVSRSVNPTDMQRVMTQAANAINAAASAAGAAGRAPPGAGDGALVVCSGNDVVSLTGKTLALPSGVPVSARDHCRLTLVACTVSGATAVEASGNARVTVQGGSVTGVGPGVSLADNAVLESSRASISGEGAITAANNARARLVASTVTGGRVAVDASGNASVDARSSSIHGQVVGGRRVKR